MNKVNITPRAAAAVLAGNGKERGGRIMSARGSQLDMKELQKLNRLPATRAEVLSVAKALIADPRNAVFLDVRATKTELNKLNRDGRLGNARVLFLATHGLLAGELKGITQPALVLTPPAVLTDDDDGLLSLEDILKVKLSSTEWASYRHAIRELQTEAARRSRG